MCNKKNHVNVSVKHAAAILTNYGRRAQQNIYGILVWDRFNLVDGYHLFS